MTRVGVMAETSLAGVLRVRPGAPLGHSLVGTRPDWVPRLVQGQPATALPGLMASLFNLCGHAHRLACELALAAAAPGLLPPPPQVAQRLRHETAAEHIRRMGLDWPRLLTDGARGAAAVAQLGALKACPLLRPQAPADANVWPTTLAWLEAHWLHMPATVWLAQWVQGGGQWLHGWASSVAATPPGGMAALVHGALAADAVCSPMLDPANALPLPLAPEGRAALAQALAQRPGFTRWPQWRGACAHTGSWTRGRATHCPPHTVWSLLGSRMAELVRLCLPAEPRGTTRHGGAPGLGEQWLCWGAAPTGQGQALAWVEMARGVLLYRVAVDLAASPGPPRVAACEVLAPTEWNFHPQGEVARRLSALDTQAPAAQTRRAVNLLMAAFDPCVPFELDMVSSQTHTQETNHA